MTNPHAPAPYTSSFDAPSNPDTAMRRAQLLLTTNRHKEAEAVLRRALADNPTHAGLMATLAGVLMLQCWYSYEALHLAHRAVGLDPEDPYPHQVLGGVLARRLSLLQAEKAFRRALELDPDDSRSYGIYALVLVLTLRLRKAARIARTGLAMDPEDETCRKLLVFFRFLMGDHHGAAEDTRMALSDDPDDGETHKLHGWALLAQRDYAGAREHLRTAVRRLPGDMDARHGLHLAERARSPLVRLLMPLLVRIHSPIPSLAYFGSLILAVLGLAVLFAFELPAWAFDAGLVALAALAHIAYLLALSGGLLNLEMGLDFSGQRPARGWAAAVQWIGVLLVVGGIVAADLCLALAMRGFEFPSLLTAFFLAQILGWPLRLAPLFQGTRLLPLAALWYGTIVALVGATFVVPWDPWGALFFLVIVPLWLVTLLPCALWCRVFPSLRHR